MDANEVVRGVDRSGFLPGLAEVAAPAQVFPAVRMLPEDDEIVVSAAQAQPSGERAGARRPAGLVAERRRFVDAPRGLPGPIVVEHQGCPAVYQVRVGVDVLVDPLGGVQMGALVFAEYNSNGCGNGLTGDQEECDGTDDAACPGQCQSDCTCPE